LESFPLDIIKNAENTPWTSINFSLNPSDAIELNSPLWRSTWNFNTAVQPISIPHC